MNFKNLKNLFFLLLLVLFSLSIYGCGNEPSPRNNTQADMFLSNLDKNKLQAGTEIGEILTYLIDKGISEGFKMKRGDGDTRLNTYTFPDNSTIVVVSRPKAAGQGLEFVELKIEK
jgi:hypothetical protein